MSNCRVHHFLFCLTFGLFIFAIGRQWNQVNAPSLQRQFGNRFDASKSLGAFGSAQSFQKVALKYGTDKVTTHKYQDLYEKYLSPLRRQPVKLLEIGLGCNMDYGPGASYYTWLEYLPKVDLYFIESDAECAEAWIDKTPNANIFIGDQADTNFLANFSIVTTVDGSFDVVIDDGGHAMTQQITSLEGLWPVVKPGGLYVIEDLQTSFWRKYGGDPTTEDDEKQTTVKYLYDVLNDIMAGRGRTSVSHELQSMDCMAEICVLSKRKPDVR